VSVGPVDVRPVRAAILSIGSELLLGDLTDSNATWISGRLRERGVEVVRHLAARDDVTEISAALHWLAAQVDLVVVGGGLGPTSDDLTREAVAAALSLPLELREDLEEAIVARFAAMGRSMAPSNRRQAFVPVGARTIPPVGTAPAFAVDLPAPHGPVRVVALPGVPWELHLLWDSFVEPQLLELGATGATITRIVHVAGRGESDVAAVVEPLVASDSDVVLAFLAKQHGIQVRLTSSGADREDARRRSQPAVDKVVAALLDAVSGLDDEDLETAVIRLLTAQGATVATAESATGGSIAARLALVPGASTALVGGLVTYRDEAKVTLAGLDAGRLADDGAVSAATTRALALAARERTGADWGIGVTAMAGPGTVDGIEIGTAFWALAAPDGTCEVHHRVLPGDRAAIGLRLGSAALDLLRRRLSHSG
jgi:nicotinamide-nucleotide amidase